MQYKKRSRAQRARNWPSNSDVAHVVEGNVQRSGNRVRVNAVLVDARTDQQLWAQTYDRDLADVFAIQSEIAKAIADQLQAKLTSRKSRAIAAKPTNNVEAYDAYLRGLGSGHRKPTTQLPTLLLHRNISERRCAWTRSSLCVGRCCRMLTRAVTSWTTIHPRSPCVKRHGKQPNTAAGLRRAQPVAEAVWAKGYYHYVVPERLS